ncbi:hypothetical protein BDE36_1800 [Arcticibacter tournemirensis]|uniref:Uncharacterized protein n=1 Tax=Arcticibacter tournemirensis TaxID=699437 RepID=A0A5M9HEL9_9SPHI|nr:hypothetical protein [Arcticibacter tournemirensis]KAA8483738.1 hypothetical protein F1649_07565 [Arcticibacter tournemirensis]TQM50065.1 hypothetical protein BDE36_1800 [Arcticibacter tournemirensis]
MVWNENDWNHDGTPVKDEDLERPTTPLIKDEDDLTSGETWLLHSYWMTGMFFLLTIIYFCCN